MTTTELVEELERIVWEIDLLKGREYEIEQILSARSVDNEL
jgi:hypothetical protein